ncbi:MAG: RNase P modulator RnpM [Anaerovoracaceae bacterium]
MKNSRKKVPMRRCIGCMESKPKKELLRIAYYEGELRLDPEGRARGRGVYLCRSADCVAKARRRGALARSLRAELSAEQVQALYAQLEEYAEKEENR